MSTLVMLLALPVAGALIVSGLPAGRPALIRGTALAVAGASLLLALVVLRAFDATVAGVQMALDLPWNPLLGTHFALGIDGVALPMVVLTPLLCLIALVASRSIDHHVKGYYALMLLLESAMLGVFTAQDWSLFYIFWELTLIPLFFLIGRWGGARRQTAALNFVLYTMGGSIFLLLSLLVLFDAVPDKSFAMAVIRRGAQALPEELQLWIFLGLLVGFGVKMPIFPLHGWLPLAHVEAPSPVSILLSGILLKMGSYGLIRAAEMLPAATLELQGLLVALALFSLIYGGLLAWRQSDLKAMIAYSSISHMAVVLVGVAALNRAGLTGAVMQMTAHALAAAALFLLIGLLYERTHTREVTHYSSLVRVTPRFAFFTTFAFAAGVGMPGTVGFVAEIHALVGGFAQWGGLVVLLSVGFLIGAAYSVRTIGRLFTGPVRRDMLGVEDLRPAEMAAAGVLSACTLALGLFPAAALELVSATVDGIGATFARAL